MHSRKCTCFSYILPTDAFLDCLGTSYLFKLFVVSGNIFSQSMFDLKNVQLRQIPIGKFSVNCYLHVVPNYHSSIT